MAIDTRMPIGEIATAAPAAAALFDRLGLDYHRHAGSTLAASCARAGLPFDRVLAAIAEELIEHNHSIEREAMKDTSALIAKVVDVHGADFPELRDLQMMWADLCLRLGAHLREERPALEPLLRGAPAPAGAAPPDAGASPHEDLIALAHRIRALTRGYRPPGDDCDDALGVVYRELAAFETELEQHALLARLVGVR